MTIEVIATRVGLYGGRVRDVGERFEIEGKADLGAWMAPVNSAEATSAPRIHERFGSPARAETGPNEALAYAEAGQLTTALNIELDALRAEKADLVARLARAEAIAAQYTAANPEARDAEIAAEITGAVEQVQKQAEDARGAVEGADFRASEQPEPDADTTADGEKPTRRRRS